jgi:putative membrane protein
VATALAKDRKSIALPSQGNDMTAVTVDALWAWAHHLCAFALIAILFSEWCLTAQEQDQSGIRRLARLDMYYGLCAALMLAAGIARLIWGAKGWSFYAGNPLFWAKLGCFALIGLLSVRPSILIFKWRREAGKISAETMRTARTWMTLQLILIPVLLLLATLIARGIGH